MVHISASFAAPPRHFTRRAALFLWLAATVINSATAQDATPATSGAQVAYAPGEQTAVPAPLSAAPRPAPSSAAPVASFRQPAFPGGPNELAKFLNENLHYPAEAAEVRVSGRVVVSFWVDETGHAYGFGALQSPHPALEAEALRVARKITDWVPGLQEGRAAPMQMYLPVVFKLMAQ